MSREGIEKMVRSALELAQLRPKIRTQDCRMLTNSASFRAI